MWRLAQQDTVNNNDSGILPSPSSSQLSWACYILLLLNSANCWIFEHQRLRSLDPPQPPNRNNRLVKRLDCSLNPPLRHSNLDFRLTCRQPRLRSLGSLVEPQQLLVSVRDLVSIRRRSLQFQSCFWELSLFLRIEMESFSYLVVLTHRTI